MDIYLPACNHDNDTAYGILTGLPTTVQYFNNRRLLVHLNERLHTILKPYLPTILQDYTTYPNLVGLRTGKFTSSAPIRKSHIVTYIATSHSNHFTSLYKAQAKHLQQNNCTSNSTEYAYVLHPCPALHPMAHRCELSCIRPATHSSTHSRTMLRYRFHTNISPLS
jgi:hypothetical protein